MAYKFFIKTITLIEIYIFSQQEVFISNGGTDNGRSSEDYFVTRRYHSVNDFY